ncbi:MAG: glycosyltransferase [Candidatus Zixiibacteriota bacterium]
MKKLLAILKLYRTRLEYTRITSESVSFILMILGALIAPISRPKAAQLLMLSHRNTFTPARQRQREYFLRFFGLFDPRVIDRMLPDTEHHDEAIFASRVITLKEPNGKEKGVILLKFLDTFSWLKAKHDIERLMKDYYIVFEMSYYGCCCPELLQYASYDDHCIVGASHSLEYGFLTRLNSNIVPANFASCNWVDDRVFHPLPAEKKYDAVYVATWNPVKRHHILFEAVSRIADPTFKAVLVGGGYGGTRYEIEKWIRYYGVENRVLVMENLSHEAINQLFSESRFSILLSLKEGGNKAIIEGMFANTPCIVLDDHISPAADWINEQTGRMVARRKLPSAMLWMRDNWQTFSPREWAMSHLHPRTTTAILEKTIRHISDQEGRGWTTPLAVKYNHGSQPRYYDDAVPHPRPIDLHLYRKAMRPSDSTSPATQSAR